MASYAVQKETRLENRDDVLRAIRDGHHRFNDLASAVRMSRRTLSNVLVELQEDVLVVRTGEGQKTRYDLTTRGLEIFKAEVSAFRDISEAYQRWHPSLVSSPADERLIVGSGAHYPVVQTGSIYSGYENADGQAEDPLDRMNMPRDPFVARASEIEGIIHRDVMNWCINNGAGKYIKGATRFSSRDPRRHGKQHIAVVIDYDALQSTWDQAGEFERAIARGDGMTLFFSKRLNSEPEDDPVLVEMEKTGLVSDYFTVELCNRERNALLIVLGTLPAMLKIILFQKERVEANRLLKAIGESVDGPFKSLMNAYRKEHCRFFASLEKIEGHSFQEKAVNYLEWKCVGNPKGGNILELMGILLLIRLTEDNPSPTLDLLRDWGAPFAFIV